MHSFNEWETENTIFLCVAEPWKKKWGIWRENTQLWPQRLVSPSCQIFSLLCFALSSLQKRSRCGGKTRLSKKLWDTELRFFTIGTYCFAKRWGNVLMVPTHVQEQSSKTRILNLSLSLRIHCITVMTVFSFIVMFLNLIACFVL